MVPLKWVADGWSFHWVYQGVNCTDRDLSELVTWQRLLPLLTVSLAPQTQLSTNNGQALAKAAANAVMSAALDGGSTDNITVVTILLDWDCEYAAD